MKTRWHKFVHAYRERRIGAPNVAIANETLEALKCGRSWLDDDCPVFICAHKAFLEASDGKEYLLDRHEPEQYRMLADNNLAKHPFDIFAIEHHLDSSETLFICIRSDYPNYTVCSFRYMMKENLYFWEWATSEPKDVFSTTMEINPNQSLLSDIADRFDVEGLEAEQYLTSSEGLFRKLMLQLATKGMVQQRVEGPKALNNRRTKKGKPRIPDVIYMRPGHYYDRSGVQHAYDERKPVRIHWRRGHVRNVWCGTGDERRLEPRYIAPCLVNYDGGDLPEHKVRITR